MNIDRNNPTPEQLAAYFDGKLSGPDSDLAAAWEMEHPDVGGPDTVFADQDPDLAQAWSAARTGSPEPAAWDRVLNEVAGAVSPSAVRTPKRRIMSLICAVAAAAAVVAAVFLGRARWSTTPQPAPAGGAAERETASRHQGETYAGAEESDEPLDIAKQEDIRFMAIEGPDEKRMIVGELPVPDQEVLEPAGFDEVRLIRVSNRELSFGDGDVPMLIDPAVKKPGWQP